MNGMEWEWNRMKLGYRMRCDGIGWQIYWTEEKPATKKKKKTKKVSAQSIDYFRLRSFPSFVILGN
jgi:hypothetical protein